MTVEGAPYAAEPGGVRLALRLTPRANRNAVDRIIQGADGRPVLQLRVAAPPVEGAANAALIAFLAEALGVRKSDIRIRSGETARIKVIFIAGASEPLIRRLTDWVA